MREFVRFILLFLLSVGLTSAVLCLILPILRRRHIGQRILEIGPDWHSGKNGTPTMGGISFVVVLVLLLVPLCVWCALIGEPLRAMRLGAASVFAVFCAGIGLLDDAAKVRAHRNKGLGAMQKFLLQLLVSAAFLLFCVRFLGLDRSVSFTLSGRSFSLGVIYFPLALLFLTGLMNAANLTDGVDGLLGTVVLIVFLAASLCARLQGAWELSLLGILLAGIALGFLFFNLHPARLFMGDTGSLFLGGAIGALAVLNDQAVVALLFCAVMVFETLSVILQVLWYKITGGKRLFLMAPFHHHLEKRGYSENKIVLFFALATITSCALGVLLWIFCKI